jgi:aryl-alcohol dehydrogenase-like predicted oxidoreductase
MNEATDRGYAEAVGAALSAGVNFIDTSLNYRNQRSERAIGTALAQAVEAGHVRRDEVVICTKAGYLVPDAVPQGSITARDVVGGMHSMTPAFLADQLGRSRQNLGIETIDVFYLHNPETQLAEISKVQFLGRIREAFHFLESVVATGKIQFYGLATWNGFRQDARARDAMQLAEIAAIAKEIAGENHHFRFVQLPFNLGMTEALTLGNQSVDGKTMTIMEASEELDVTLIASASLLQGQVADNLPEFVEQALGLDSDAERALQFVRSSPGITTALVGMSREEHVHTNAKLVSVAPATIDQFSKLFSRGQSST